MATEKIANYTAEQVAEMLEAYTANPTKATVEALAASMGKTAKSIVAKLVREGVYKSEIKEVVGKRTMLKSEYVAEIAKLVGKTDEQLESLEKATSGALAAVFAALKRGQGGQGE